MTMFGKILVCVNLAVSLMMAIVALGIYTNRINWTDSPKEATPEKAAGELAIRQKEIEKKLAAIKLAEVRQQVALGQLRNAEQQRPADKKWYAQQLDHMLKTADEKNPAKLLTITPDGKVVPDDKNFGRPLLTDGKDRSKLELRALQAYEKDLVDIYDLIQVEREKLTKLAEEGTKLTSLLTGGKGLRQRIEDEEDKRQRVEQQLKDFTHPRLVNILVESELLLKRRNALTERKEELNKSPVLPVNP